MRTTHNGCLYREQFNRGNGRGFAYRWVAEMSYNGMRLRYRSTQRQFCLWWLERRREEIENLKKAAQVKPCDIVNSQGSNAALPA